MPSKDAIDDLKSIAEALRENRRACARKVLSVSETEKNPRQAYGEHMDQLVKTQANLEAVQRMISDEESGGQATFNRY